MQFADVDNIAIFAHVQERKRWRLLTMKQLANFLASGSTPNKDARHIQEEFTKVQMAGWAAR